MRLNLNLESNWLSNCGYSHQKQIEIYDEQLEDIMLNTRWYLDHLDEMKEYRVFWTRYTRKLKTTLPFRYKKTLPFKKESSPSY
jgi:hypothetical protein